MRLEVVQDPRFSLPREVIILKSTGRSFFGGLGMVAGDKAILTISCNFSGDVCSWWCAQGTFAEVA